MNTLYKIEVISDNKPDVLYRIAGLFLRRKITIESLYVSKVKEKNVLTFTIIMEQEKQTLEKLVKHIERIIEVHLVKVKSTR